MYLPEHFRETRESVLHEAIRAHPLALLVHDGAGTLDADPLPLMLEPPAAGRPARLRGHVARANPLWRSAAGREVLVVFQGPQAYVTPAWYPAKAEHGKVVPTWNYVVVQARGTLRAIEDLQALHALVSTLTDRHEAARPQPWQVGDAPADYIEKLLGAIVGIEIELASLVGKWKVSQNRGGADRSGVADGLATLPGEQARAMAALVRPPP